MAWNEKGRDLMAFALGVKETMKCDGILHPTARNSLLPVIEKLLLFSKGASWLGDPNIKSQRDCGLTWEMILESIETEGLVDVLSDASHPVARS